MILLEPGNRILGETVKANVLAEGKVDPCDVRLCDFDDVTYRVQVTPEDPSNMRVSMNLPCYHQIQKKGAEKSLNAAFAGMVDSNTETGFDITLKVPCGSGKGTSPSPAL
jgi:hypothetical protein